MSLLAAQALTTNQVLLSRVEAAIRKTAAQRLQWEGPAGDLARAAFTAPADSAPAFMLRLATNGDVVDAACEACGHASGVPDDTIEWIVGDSWEAIAQDLYGSPDDPA